MPSPSRVHLPQLERPRTDEIAALERDVRELRQAEEALQRLHTLEYGICFDCREEIPYNRLHATPLALRALPGRVRTRVGADCLTYALSLCKEKAPRTQTRGTCHYERIFERRMQVASRTNGAPTPGGDGGSSGRRC